MDGFPAAGRKALDCGLYENGFARIRCPECAEEYLLAFSCETRELCPSCLAKRSAGTAALLAEDVLEEVGHAQWVFVIPKMLRHLKRRAEDKRGRGPPG
jgi:ribosomal protein S27E